MSRRTEKTMLLVEKIKRLAEQGYSTIQIALRCEISITTVNWYKHAYRIQTVKTSKTGRPPQKKLNECYVADWDLIAQNIKAMVEQEGNKYACHSIYVEPQPPLPPQKKEVTYCEWRARVDYKQTSQGLKRGLQTTVTRQIPTYRAEVLA